MQPIDESKVLALYLLIVDHEQDTEILDEAKLTPAMAHNLNAQARKFGMAERWVCARESLS